MTIDDFLTAATVEFKTPNLNYTQGSNRYFAGGHVGPLGMTHSRHAATSDGVAVSSRRLIDLAVGTVTIAAGIATLVGSPFALDYQWRLEYALRASSTLGGNLSASQTSVTVASFTGMPSSGNFEILVDDEKMTVTAGHGTNYLTVTRGASGTTPTTHGDGAAVYEVQGANSVLRTRLSGLVDASRTSFNVRCANMIFPQTLPFDANIDSEQVTVTGRSGDILSVTRGVNGTTAAAHATGATLYIPRPNFQELEIGFGACPAALSGYVALTDEQSRVSWKRFTHSTPNDALTIARAAFAGYANLDACERLIISFDPATVDGPFELTGIDMTVA